MSQTKLKQPTGELASVDKYRQLKIGEVSKISGIGIETLRFYEKSGLLERPGRTESGYRIYDGSVLERLRFIKRSQSLGLTLDEIRQIIAEKRAGQSPCKHVRALVRTHLEEIDARLAEMKRDRDELESTLADWDKAGDVDGHVCGLIEGAELRPDRMVAATQTNLSNRSISSRKTSKKKLQKVSKK